MTDRELMQQALEVLERCPALYRAPEAATALRERLAQPVQEPVAWKNAALRVGEDLCSVGPFGYYDMTAEQWLDWALSVVTVHAPPPAQQEPVAWIWKYANGEEEVVFVPPRHVDATHVDAPSTITPLYTSPPAQRKPLTDEEIKELYGDDDNFRMTKKYVVAFARAIEAAHGIGEKK